MHKGYECDGLSMMVTKPSSPVLFLHHSLGPVLSKPEFQTNTLTQYGKLIKNQERPGFKHMER